MFEKVVVIDGKDHILGRLAAVVAKQLLNGQRVVIVRAERIVLTGTLDRLLREWALYRKKNSVSNPFRGGPWHYKAPAKIAWKCIRGMIPHKTARGAAAMARLKIFEGCPHPYSHQKKKVVTNALRTVVLDSFRKSVYLGEFSARVGWNHGAVVESLEVKRKARAQKYYNDKVISELTSGGPAQGRQEGGSQPARREEGQRTTEGLRILTNLLLKCVSISLPLSAVLPAERRPGRRAGRGRGTAGCGTCPAAPVARPPAGKSRSG